MRTGGCFPPRTGDEPRAPAVAALAMIIVAGALYVDPVERDSYLQECLPVIIAARATQGCADFHLAADPLEPDRINVFEQWDSAEAVERFRGSGRTEEQAAVIRDARVFQHEVASTVAL